MSFSTLTAGYLFRTGQLCSLKSKIPIASLKKPLKKQSERLRVAKANMNGREFCVLKYQ
jgi:hypothetical protein